MKEQKTTRSTVTPTGKNFGGILTNGISIKKSCPRQEAFVARTTRCPRAVPSLPLRWPPRNHGTSPSIERAARGPVLWSAHRAARADAENKDERPRQEKPHRAE